MRRAASLLAAPHRMPFLAGSLGLAGLACWWLAYLLALHMGWTPVFQGTLPPALLHGPLMLYTGMAPFLFGFLLTVFPRWMGMPDLVVRQYAPVGLGLLAAMLLVQIGLWSGTDALLRAGLAVEAVGWATALAVLLAVLRANARAGTPRCWHAWSAFAALLLGLGGLCAALTFVWRGDAALLPFANRTGIGGLLLPIFLTVAHRMVPFFAANVVPGYVRWRPDWLLGALWALLLARLGAELFAHASLLIAANSGLAIITALMCWKWWPRTKAPGLLNALVWGFAWAPIGFALSAAATFTDTLGRGPDHALMIGFCGSMLIAMVTRVTHGHSGRPLAMHKLAWLAFGMVQFAALGRVLAGLRMEDTALLTTAAGLFAVGIVPWTLRNSTIYLAPRRDGRPG